MRLLQWLPLPSIFVLSSVMRRLYREGAKARQKKEGVLVHEEENRGEAREEGEVRRSRVYVYAHDVDTRIYIYALYINVSLYEFVHLIHSRIYSWSHKYTRLRYVYIIFRTKN